MTYGGAAVRITAVMLLFIGIKERKQNLLIPHLLIQIFSFMALFYPIWTTVRNLYRPKTNSNSDYSSKSAMLSSTEKIGTTTAPDKNSDIVLILCGVGVALESVFFLIILTTFFSFRTFNLRPKTATEALLNSINNQWKGSSNVNVSSCMLEIYSRDDRKSSAVSETLF